MDLPFTYQRTWVEKKFRGYGLVTCLYQLKYGEKRQKQNKPTADWKLGRHVFLLKSVNSTFLIEIWSPCKGWPHHIVSYWRNAMKTVFIFIFLWIDKEKYRKGNSTVNLMIFFFFIFFCISRLSSFENKSLDYWYGSRNKNPKHKALTRGSWLIL